MKFVSFDVGEKNFAYSIISLKNNKLIIEKIAHYNILKKKNTNSY
jgi:hypothetical protein